jgi:hypothetical protein
MPMSVTRMALPMYARADQAALPAGVRPDALGSRRAAARRAAARHGLVGDEDQTVAALAQLEYGGSTARLHILASVWAMAPAWFVPFSAAERWLALGSDGNRPSAAATASATRALLYSTAMSRARRRVARGLAALRGTPPGFEDAAWEPLRAEAELTEIGRWLEEFHPYSLVELDYGGLVQLLSDDALSGDQSVAEINAAIEGAPKGEYELTVAMYKRAHSRWRAFAGFELAN